MQRKLIQLSPSTNVVSLPSAWIKANNLKKGTDIFLHEAENNLIISVHPHNEQKEITIDVSELPTKLVWVTINAAYVTGYDSIIVNTKDQEQTAYMSNVVRYFPGMIIYDERNKSVTFKDLGQETDISVDKIIMRLFHLITTFFEDGITAIKQKDWATLADMKKRDYTINSYVAYCFRHINKYGYTPFSKIGIISIYVKTLELFADKLALLFVGIGRKKQNIKVDTLTVVLNLFRTIFQLYTNYSLTKLAAIEQTRTTLQQDELVDLLFALEEATLELHT